MSETESYHAMMQRQMQAQQEVRTWREHHTTCPSCFCSVSRGQAMSHVKDLMHQGEQLLARAQEFEVEVPEQIMAMLRSADYHVWIGGYQWLQNQVGKARENRRLTREAVAREAVAREEREAHSEPNFIETLKTWWSVQYGEQPDGPSGPDTPPDEPDVPLAQPDTGELINPYRGIARVNDVPWTGEAQRDDERELVRVR